MKRILVRVIAILPALLVEALAIYLFATVLKPWATLIAVLLRILGFLFVLFIISNRQEGTYKILWLLFFTIFPLAAAVAYLLWGNKRTVKPIIERVEAARKEMGAFPEENTTAMEKIKAEDVRIAQSFEYVSKLSGFPAQDCEGATYYPIGEDCWRAMLEEMRKAEKYIYLEYFIVQEGLMWGEITKVLAEKIKAGVDVRFIYDDVGSLTTFSSNDTQKLDSLGIKWIAFNPLEYVSGTLNNRTHRKMLIIDGRVAFSGGVNLADEYINVNSHVGHWKDIGFRITGPAVGNYLAMFTQFWNAFSEDKIPATAFDLVAKTASANDGVILSWYDSPGSRDPISNNFYIEMLSSAKRYAWFYSPYLMIGDTLQDAFVRAAQRGVDVRIIMPGVPDKKTVFRLSRSFYGALLEAGVKIYQYTPGFVHAKATLYDDEVCTIGTVNLDYRSLFLHFENNSAFWHSAIIKDLKSDYLATLEKCENITLESLNQSLSNEVIDGILRIFAPLC